MYKKYTVLSSLTKMKQTKSVRTNENVSWMHKSKSYTSMLNSLQRCMSIWCVPENPEIVCVGESRCQGMYLQLDIFGQQTGWP